MVLCLNTDIGTKQIFKIHKELIAGCDNNKISSVLILLDISWKEHNFLLTEHNLIKNSTHQEHAKNKLSSPLLPSPNALPVHFIPLHFRIRAPPLPTPVRTHPFHYSLHPISTYSKYSSQYCHLPLPSLPTFHFPLLWYSTTVSSVILFRFSSSIHFPIFPPSISYS